MVVLGVLGVAAIYKLAPYRTLAKRRPRFALLPKYKTPISRQIVREPIGVQSDLTVEASWVVAFDTGDFWQFTTELTGRLEST